VPKVICDLENASNLINGVKFSEFDGVGLISDEISEEQAAHFCGIPGYLLYEEAPQKPSKLPKPPKPEPSTPPAPPVVDTPPTPEPDEGVF
jgi:hypothetical protein